MSPPVPHKERPGGVDRQLDYEHAAMVHGAGGALRTTRPEEGADCVFDPDVDSGLRLPKSQIRRVSREVGGPSHPRPGISICRSVLLPPGANPVFPLLRNDRDACDSYARWSGPAHG